MTRKAWVYNIVYSMLLPGDGNAVVLPVMRDGYIDELIPLKPSMTSFEETPTGYKIISTAVRNMIQAKYYTLQSIPIQNILGRVQATDLH